MKTRLKAALNVLLGRPTIYGCGFEERISYAPGQKNLLVAGNTIYTDTHQACRRYATPAVPRS